MFELPPVALDTAPAIAALKTLQADPALQYAVGDARLDAPRTLDALAAPRARAPAGDLAVGLDRHRPLGQQDVPRRCPT